MITIAVDAMGGDNAPEAIVQGCLDAVELFDDIRVKLFGPAERIAQLVGEGAQRVEIIDAPDVISNHDHPTMAIRRKKESSLVRALESVKRGEADAAVSCGSTGAVLAGGIFIVGRISGIERPALAPLLPTAADKPVMLIDCGANVDSKPQYLADFALMGSIYMEKAASRPKPAVALVNIGEEAEKGNELTKAAYPLLAALPINFTGNIEGRDLLGGDADVLVCDGFTGNLVLKFAEGLTGTVMGMMKKTFLSSLRTKLGAMLLKPALRSFKHRMDYTEYGGAPLLGVNGVVIKGHGSSNAHAVERAIYQARLNVQTALPATIARAIAGVRPET